MRESTTLKTIIGSRWKKDSKEQRQSAALKAHYLPLSSSLCIFCLSESSGICATSNFFLNIQTTINFGPFTVDTGLHTCVHIETMYICHTLNWYPKNETEVTEVFFPHRMGNWWFDLFIFFCFFFFLHVWLLCHFSQRELQFNPTIMSGVKGVFWKKTKHSHVGININHKKA